MNVAIIGPGIAIFGCLAPRRWPTLNLISLLGLVLAAGDDLERLVLAVEGESEHDLGLFFSA